VKTILFHVNSFLAGGIEKVLLEVLHAIDPSKYRVRLSITYNLGDKEVHKKEIPPYVEVYYLLNSPLLISTQRKKLTSKISVLEKVAGELIFPPIRKQVKKKALERILKDTDVVIDFDTTLAGFHELFADKRTVAYCHFSFSQIWNGNKRKLDKLANRLNQYDRVVMLCDEMKEDTAKMYPSLEPKLVRIYNALDKEKVLAVAKEPIDTTVLNGQEYIVSVGRLHEAQKDFTTLVKAYIDCVRRHSIKEYLVIVGYGGALESLQQIAADAGMQDRIIFTGFDPNPYKWIKNASLFLFSSKYEGLPTVIIEALLLEKPVIATACPTGVKELLMYGQAGILTKVGDITEMSEALNKLLKDKPLQQQYIQASKKIVHNFDADYMISEFERLLLN
jgi:glycosyltransferase involved in cell wall biosynthesis